MVEREEWVGTDSEIAKAWNGLVPVIEAWQKRVDTRESLDIAAGSSLAADDEHSKPCEVSYSVDSNIHVAVDHLHAVKVLVHDSKVLHTMAPFTLVRGALESLSAAFWILHPTSRTERITRSLLWSAKNYKDQRTAFTPLELDPSAYGGLKPRMDSIFEVAARRGIPNEDVDRRLFSTDVVLYVDERMDALQIAFIWRLCSGFAHGRPWAILGSSHKEEREPLRPDTVALRLSADPERVVIAVAQAVALLNTVAELRQLRATNHLG
ncbi:hypothetical protein [Nocardia cyriacigeorgica]|uniref:Uncharacterized protein n=1 Tax=Nocardia cyriacigeorgica TaxID=135487 RepID=A0A5R8NE96_9NOCA|nr:hypothetical protein [Nocardia cyriacigeorgica]TLF74041.1 hypothetical protein FEK34_25300 [Nocardia cyriacigeorgica]